MRDSSGSRTFFFSCPITFTLCFHFHLPEILSSKPSRCGNAGPRDKWELSGSVISSNTACVQTKVGARRRITFWPIRFARAWLRRFPGGRMCFCPTTSKPPPRTPRRGVPTLNTCQFPWYSAHFPFPWPQNRGSNCCQPCVLRVCRWHCTAPLRLSR
jgi:hypothetical protein